MTYTEPEKVPIDHLKKMKVGDIWRDKYGDYLLVLGVSKSGVRTKDKFSIYINAILLTNVTNDKDVHSGMYVDDYIPELIMEKIA